MFLLHAFNGHFIFFIQRCTSLRLVCISNVSYLQLKFNLQLKNEHVCGIGLTGWSLVFHGFFHRFHILSILKCVFLKGHLFSDNLFFLLSFWLPLSKMKKALKNHFFNGYETQTFKFSVCLQLHKFVCKQKAIKLLF